MFGKHLPLRLVSENYSGLETVMLNPLFVQSVVAAILRGIFEMECAYGSWTTDVEVFIGGGGPTFRRGQARLFLIPSGTNGNTTFESGALLLAGTENLGV